MALRFKKTLVIGLGTSGKEICSAIAERLQWQYGKPENIPWVRFFVLETNRSVPRGALDGQDIQPLNITAAELASIKKNPGPHDEQMDLSNWVDWRTLDQLPDGQVTAGAGNIRMIGRLALLYTENYNRVREGIRARVEELRRLDPHKTQDAFRTAYGADAPHIELDSGLRVFVVGSLCGGTCSGTVTDFGYIVKDVLGTKREDESTVAMLTLPNADLNPSTEPLANRFKYNAFNALQELNHFHYRPGGGEAEIPSIRAGGEWLDTGDEPYDAVYIMTPQGTDRRAVVKLHRAIAERIYINIFNDGADTSDKLADAKRHNVNDTTGHAFAFCTFGLSVIEYPVQEVLKACTYRLLWKAFDRWVNYGQDDDMAALARRFVGIDTVMDSITSAQGQQANKPIREEVEEQEERILQLCRTDEAAARRAIRELRDKFRTDYPERAVHTARAVAEQVYERVLNYVQGTITRPGGLHKSRMFVSEVLKQLDELTLPTAAAPAALAPFVEAALHAAASYNPGWLPKLLAAHTVKNKLASLVNDVRNKLHNELGSHKAELARQVLAADGSFRRHLLPEIKRLQRRLDLLSERVNLLMSKLDDDAQNLARHMPDVPGKALFVPGWPEGTVLARYTEVFKSFAQQKPGKAWEDEEQDKASEIITLWTELPDVVGGRGADWLNQNLVRGDEKFIPKEVLSRLETAAREVFDQIRRTSVVTELMGREDREEIARAVVDQMSTFVTVSEEEVRFSGGTPLQTATRVLIPGSPDDRSKVEELLRNNGLLAISEDYKPSQDPSRIVLLQERLRFPLRAAPAIVDQTSGVSRALSNAVCGDFHTFATRSDVEWIPISFNDQKAMADAKDYLALGILLGVVALEGGKLKFDVHQIGPGEAGTCELPGPAIQRATRRLMWAQGEESLPAGVLLEQLKDKVHVAMAKLAEEKTHLGAIEELERRLNKFEATGVPDLGKFGSLAITHFCVSSEGPAGVRWKDAYNTKYAPSDERKKRMWKQAGEGWPNGKGTYDKKGYYCLTPGCYSIVGENDDEAARNEWRCRALGHQNR